MNSDNLAEYLESITRQDRYRVDATLKASDLERTEVVFLQGADGSESGPYVRKTIKRDAGIGNAYERIFTMQQKGYAFTHIPRLHECYFNETDLVVIMDYVRGETLQDLVYRNDPSPTLVRDVFPQLCDAVTELHEVFDPPLIHRDLKPSNVMVAHGVVYIIDFGIARDYKDQVQTDTMYFGTRAYAPPEQYGFGQTTVRSDIYALGMLLYYCLTEKIPDSQVTQNGFENPLIPPPFRSVLTRATAFDPLGRYASAREMKGAIENALFGPGGYATQSNQVPEPRAAEAYPQQQVTQTTNATALPSAGFTSPNNGRFVPFEPSKPMQPLGSTEQSAPLLQSFNAPAPADNKPISKVGIVYNIVLALATLFILTICFMLATGHLPVNNGNHPIVNAIGYSFLMPVFFAATAILLMYKRPFAKRFPNSFGRLSRWHYIVGYFCIVFVLIIVLGVLAVVFAQQ